MSVKSSQTMNATKARANFFDLVNEAFYSKKETIITKNGQVMARIMPPSQEEFDWKEYEQWLKNLKPFLTEEDVKNMQATRDSFNTPRFPEWEKGE